MSDAAHRFEHAQHINGAGLAEVRAIIARATEVDGAGPVDDQVRSELAYGSTPEAAHVLLRDGDGLVGYAHVSVGTSTASAHLVVDPDRRRVGHGGALLDHLLGIAEGSDDTEPVGPTPRVSHRRLLVWAHGDTDGAQAIAASHSFARVRDLWQMRRSLATAFPEAHYPADVLVRTFRPGEDDEAWVALNAAAFASHPEQGRLTVEDLHRRMSEPWFDPEGFFLAERDGSLIGSHWTKVHPPREGHRATDAAGPIGEVYAVGVHPDAQGLGLGKALTLTGLQHLRDSRLSHVMLYVDGDNTAAVRLYETLGFERTAVDVMYASP